MDGRNKQLAASLRPCLRCALQDFMLPALLYLTVRNPPWYVWVLNISIAVVYFAVAVLGSIGAVRFIVLARFRHPARLGGHAA